MIKVFVETSGGTDSEKTFKASQFANILDIYSNTIRLNVVLPFVDEKTKEAKGLFILLKQPSYIVFETYQIAHCKNI